MADYCLKNRQNIQKVGASRCLQQLFWCLKRLNLGSTWSEWRWKKQYFWYASDGKTNFLGRSVYSYPKHFRHRLDQRRTQTWYVSLREHNLEPIDCKREFRVYGPNQRTFTNRFPKQLNSYRLNSRSGRLFGCEGG